MTNEIKINGTQNFMGYDIPIIEGGFGEKCKCVAINTIADIHGARLDKLNELIANNIDEFEIGVDIIDLMSNEKSLNLAKGLGFITNNRQKHCYLLSEQGYMLLVGFMKSDKAKQVRKKLRREYFAMRAIINSNEQMKANLLLTIYGGGVEGVVASRKLVDLEIKPLVEQIEIDKPMMEFADHIKQSEDSIDMKEMAKFASKNGVKIGRNNLFKFLREKNVIMFDNEPYQKYIDNDWLELIENTVVLSNGEIKITKKPLVKPKGQIGIVKMLKKYCA